MYVDISRASRDLGVRHWTTEHQVRSSLPGSNLDMGHTVIKQCLLAYCSSRNKSIIFSREGCILRKQIFFGLIK